MPGDRILPEIGSPEGFIVSIGACLKKGHYPENSDDNTGDHVSELRSSQPLPELHSAGDENRNEAGTCQVLKPVGNEGESHEREIHKTQRR